MSIFGPKKWQVIVNSVRVFVLSFTGVVILVLLYYKDASPLWVEVLFHAWGIILFCSVPLLYLLYNRYFSKGITSPRIVNRKGILHKPLLVKRGPYDRQFEHHTAFLFSLSIFGVAVLSHLDSLIGGGVAVLTMIGSVVMCLVVVSVMSYLMSLTLFSLSRSYSRGKKAVYALLTQRGYVLEKETLTRSAYAVKSLEEGYQVVVVYNICTFPYSIIPPRPVAYSGVWVFLPLPGTEENHFWLEAHVLERVHCVEIASRRISTCSHQVTDTISIVGNSPAQLEDNVAIWAQITHVQLEIEHYLTHYGSFCISPFIQKGWSWSKNIDTQDLIAFLTPSQLCLATYLTHEVFLEQEAQVVEDLLQFAKKYFPREKNV